MVEILRVVVLSLMSACAVLSWLFVFIYSGTTWWENAYGRHLMRLTAIIGATYTHTVLASLLDMKPLTRLTIWVILTVLSAAEIGNRIRLLMLSRHEAEAEAEAFRLRAEQDDDRNPR